MLGFVPLDNRRPKETLFICIAAGKKALAQRLAEMVSPTVAIARRPSSSPTARSKQSSPLSGISKRGARVKTIQIGPDEILHRFLTPKWAFLPPSGARAAIDSGRGINRPGRSTLLVPFGANCAGAIQTGRQHYSTGHAFGLQIALAEVADVSQGLDTNVWHEA
ncbi:hypothetical protein [Mesorhizobium sp. B2-6-4]|uniref:hypothetical protein n=1 Tax=Mesorhizobium sp. B2-6-4 TaxID=2589913 RepID=UPI001FEEDC17|nr:hypothetical protein [Mesorhizobium sp. B2-6-4]